MARETAESHPSQPGTGARDLSGQAPVASVAPAAANLSGAAIRRQVEADWIEATVAPVSTRSDSAGAVDGVRNGRYGFHTGHGANPWWQVDLESVTTVGRVVIYNRLDYAPGLHNADNLHILTSRDGREWVRRYENQGEPFGGIHGGGPLTVSFPEPIEARFVRIQVPSEATLFLHFDEVEAYGPRTEGPNLALRRPTDQSSLSPWSTPKVRLRGDYPTARAIASGVALARHLEELDVPVDQHVSALDGCRNALAALPVDAPDDAHRALYLRTRWAVRRLVFANPDLAFDRLLLVKRFTQQTYPDVCLNHMPWVSRPGGDICILESKAGEGSLADVWADPATGRETPVMAARGLIADRLGPGHVHGMDLWFGGDRVVFGYARKTSAAPPEGWLDRRTSFRLRRSVEPTHLFETNIDGSGLRQLTDGEWSDLDPTYLPSGDIAFVSERCGTSLQCNEYDKDETSCNLYVMRPDGQDVRRLSVNKDGDYLPHTLDNGMIGYTRWEYHERSFAFIQSLWVVRPDGTGAEALFKQHFANPWALEDVRSIPGSHRLAAIAAGHHTLAVGPLVLIDPRQGINNPAGIRIVTPSVKPPEGGMSGTPVPGGGVVDPDGFYSTPWPLSETTCLVSYTYGTSTTNPTGYGLYVVDVFGNKELLLRDPNISCFMPMPLRPRPRPPIVASAVERPAEHATCVVTNVGYGVDGIDPKRIRYIRVSEPIGWPYDNEAGGMRYIEDHGCAEPTGEKQLVGNWTPVRILGDVPVAPDGSAAFTVPADTAVYFQALDENRMDLRRMRSFVSFQPGEARGCHGCHETRDVAPLPVGRPQALARTPSPPVPPPWGDRPLSFLRDVQPVLDRHCVSCHAGLTPAGKLDLSPGLTAYDAAVPGYGYNRAYAGLMERGLVSVSPARKQDAAVTPALAYGSHRSRLIDVLNDASHRKRVRLAEEDWLRLTMWIDANAPYHDRFINKRLPMTPYDLAADGDLKQRLLEVHERRCAGCHTPAAVTRLDWVDLHAPAASRFLRAPLAREAGGSEACGQPVYPSAGDPDYRRLLDAVSAAVRTQWERPRRDLLTLIPRRAAAD